MRRGESGLRRGLHIPSRRATITSGFSLPPLLVAQGVSKKAWKVFTHELRGYARLSGTQFMEYIAISIGYGMLGHIISPHFGAIPAFVMTNKWAKKAEHSNFLLAHASGEFESFATRWNKTYFEPLGLHVVIAIAGEGRTEDADIVSTRLFRHRQKTYLLTPTGSINSHYEPEEVRYIRNNGHERVKAIQKARIIFLPSDRPDPTHDDTPSYVALQESGQIDTIDLLDGERDSDRSESRGRPPSDEGWIPAGRRVAASTKTLQPAS